MLRSASMAHTDQTREPHHQPQPLLPYRTAVLGLALVLELVSQATRPPRLTLTSRLEVS